MNLLLSNLFYSNYPMYRIIQKKDGEIKVFGPNGSNTGTSGRARADYACIPAKKMI